MEWNDDVAKLIFQLEYLIGSECYNPNSYDGWTGIEGLDYRYPVYIFPNEDAEEPVKSKTNLAESRVYPEVYDGEYGMKNVRSMKYKFGSNHLFIGIGLIKVLEELEERYGISFAELEKKRKESSPD